MAEYGYYDSKKSAPKREHRPWWVWLVKGIDILFIAALIVCSVLLICAYLAKYISPAATSFFSFWGLIFPILYIIEVVCALYWVVRWRWYAFVAAGVLLFGSLNARLFYQMDLREHYGVRKPTEAENVVMSYNVMNYRYPQADKNDEPLEMIYKFVRANNVDILCLQETTHGDKEQGVVDEYLPDMKYRAFYQYSATDARRNPSGLAIYSRYPIVAKGIVHTDRSAVRSIWADVRIKRDTVRIINNHLQSTYISNSDVDFLSSFHLVGEERSRNHLREIVSKLNENYKTRAPQADAIAKFIKSSPYPVVVCGDFNDTPLSYTYNTLSSGLNDSFVAKGRGTAGTYNGFFNMFRIDYVLMSDDLEVYEYYPFDVVYSDHNPIAASFEFISNR